jgi:hypothetical protein
MPPSEIRRRREQCLSGYDPTRHAPGSDEEYRNRIAVAAIDGAPTREEFERRLPEAIELHLPELQPLRDKFLSMLPTDLMVVCDARGVWGNRELLLRMNETMNIVSQARATVRKG